MTVTSSHISKCMFASRDIEIDTSHNRRLIESRGGV